MPIAHSSGLVRFLRAIFLDVILVVGPPDRLIGPDAASLQCVNDMLEYGSVDAANFLPSTLEALCKSPESLERLSKLKFIGFGGGALSPHWYTPLIPTAPLPKETGDRLVSSGNITLHNSLGSSDGGAFVTYEPDPEDWQYVCYCPLYNGIEWRSTSDEFYEMVVVRDPKLSKFQSCFKTFPNLHEWSTRDLYSKHPTKPHLWRHEARMDDLIVSANGAKFNPLGLQTRLEQHPTVKFALVVGNRRMCPSLIIQLRDPHNIEEKEQELWEVVAQMNEKSPRQGKVARSMMLFTKPEKPFPLAGKATVQKAAAEKLYAEELEELYAARPEAAHGY